MEGETRYLPLTFWGINWVNNLALPGTNDGKIYVVLIMFGKYMNKSDKIIDVIIPIFNNMKLKINNDSYVDFFQYKEMQDDFVLVNSKLIESYPKIKDN